MAPAPRRRVRVTCAISCAKLKVMSTPASGRPKSAPLMRLTSGRCTLQSRHALAELVGRDRDRREGGRGLGLVEAEALGELAGNQVAQRPVVDQREQLDVRRRPAAASVPIGTSSVITAISASRSMPQASSRERHVVARAEQVVRAALVDQRIGPERRRHFGAARLAHQLHVIDVGAAVHPVIGARQRRGALRGIERHHVPACAGLASSAAARSASRGASVSQSSSAACSVGAMPGTGRQRAQVAAHDDQPAVAAAALEGGEFHGSITRVFQLST